MNYTQMQATLKMYRESGITLRCKLNANTDTLRTELERIMNDEVYGCCPLPFNQQNDITSDEFIDSIVADMQATLDQPTWEELNELHNDTEEATTKGSVLCLSVASVQTLTVINQVANMVLEVSVDWFDYAWQERTNVLQVTCYVLAAIYLVAMKTSELGTNIYHQLVPLAQAFIFIPMLYVIGQDTSTIEATWGDR